MTSTMLDVIGPHRRGNRLWTPEGWRPAQVGSGLMHAQLNQWDEWRQKRLALGNLTVCAHEVDDPAHLIRLLSLHAALSSLLKPSQLAYAASTTHKAYETIASVLTTELNSLANNGYSAASSAQGSDGTGGPLFADFEMVTGGSQSATNSVVGELYVLRSADGTNYETSPSSTNPGTDAYAGQFIDASGSTTKRAVLRDIPNPPGLWKALYKNLSGSTHAASSNTVKVRHHNLATA